MNEIIVRELRLPCGIRAFTLPDAQGDYNVYLNCALTAEQREKSLRHEKEHIRRGDFYSDLPARDVEEAMASELNEQR